MLGRGDEIPAPIPFYSKEGGETALPPNTQGHSSFHLHGWLSSFLPPSSTLPPSSPCVPILVPPSFLLSLILRSAVRRSLGPSSCPPLPHAS